MARSCWWASYTQWSILWFYSFKIKFFFYYTHPLIWFDSEQIVLLKVAREQVKFCIFTWTFIQSILEFFCFIIVTIFAFILFLTRDINPITWWTQILLTVPRIYNLETFILFLEDGRSLVFRAPFNRTVIITSGWHSRITIMFWLCKPGKAFLYIRIRYPKTRENWAFRIKIAFFTLNDLNWKNLSEFIVFTPT